MSPAKPRSRCRTLPLPTACTPPSLTPLHTAQIFVCCYSAASSCSEPTFHSSSRVVHSIALLILSIPLQIRRHTAQRECASSSLSTFHRNLSIAVPCSTLIAHTKSSQGKIAPIRVRSDRSRPASASQQTQSHLFVEALAPPPLDLIILILTLSCRPTTSCHCRLGSVRSYFERRTGVEAHQPLRPLHAHQPEHC